LEKGYLCLVLHAHLPFIKHPECEDFLEEDWLYEALTETYLPLVDIFDRLISEGVDFRITMSLTPPLCAMLSDELLQNRYLNHINKLIELADKERKQTNRPEFQKVAEMYWQRYNLARHIFEDVYHRNILNAFKKFQDVGKLEIMTCTATHGFLPLMLTDNARRAQIMVATQDYQEKFGRPPRGIWLAECGYIPGVESLLKEAGIQFFFLDTHGILYGTPRPRFAVYAPVYTQSGVAAFARDVESSAQVWSAEHGYPGDYWYREFYRDMGYDADYSYIKPYLHSDGIRRNIGIKYYRITGDIPLNRKQIYDPDAAREKAASHAGNFMFNREKQVKYLHEHLGRQPIIVAPYDAELFGHWWYEGPQFIDYLLRKIHYDQKTLKTITPHEYLTKYPKNQILKPCMSSWGDKGYNEVWLNGTNDWIYPHLHQAEKRMIGLTQKHHSAHGKKLRALNQAARELLLAQSSDWAFIMTTGTALKYAVRRTREHIWNFTKLWESINSGGIDDAWLSELEHRNNVFPYINYRVYA